MRNSRLFSLPLLVVLAATAADKPKPDLDGFDAFVSATMKEWKAPGVAIAVVEDGKVILARGYGLRDVKSNLPVTPKTLFAIGSSTKSFTVSSLGVLVDQGKLEWDRPVREFLPDFRLHDEVATGRMTPRDLVTHRSGLPRHDLMWYNSPRTRQQIYDRLRFLEPSKDFRSTWQYQNLMFMTAGYLAGRVADMPWEELVRQKIFAPLGMQDSNFSVEDSKRGADYALPYSKVKEEVKEIPFRNIDTIGPAGSINSNITDMVNYLQMQMNKGRFGERQVLSESNVTQMQSPQMVMPGASSRAELGHSSYGMGWIITTYRGRKLVHHGGNIDGFSALVTFMPQAKIGMVILTNVSGSPAPSVLSYNVYDRLLGLDQVAWTERLREDEKKSKDAEEEAKKRGLTPRREGTRPSHELKDYVGEYEHPGYGIMRVSLEQGVLRAAINGLNGTLNHFHYDVFEFAEDPLLPLQKTKLMFQTSLQGDVESLSAPFETSLKPIIFTRLADRAMLDPKFLEPLAGQYQIGPVTATVSLQGDKGLTLTMPGQPVYELVPVKDLRFNVKGLTGFSLEFKKDAAGLAAEVIFYQPNGTFVAKRK